MLRALSILLILGLLGKVIFSLNKERIKVAVGTTVNDAKIKADIERMQDRLPKTLDNGVVIERVEYVDQVVRASAKEPFKKEISHDQRDIYRQNLIKDYCTGSMKQLSDNKVKLEYVFTTRARSLDDLSTETWKAKLDPADCH